MKLFDEGSLCYGARLYERGSMMDVDPQMYVEPAWLRVDLMMELTSCDGFWRRFYDGVGVGSEWGSGKRYRGLYTSVNGEERSRDFLPSTPPQYLFLVSVCDVGRLYDWGSLEGGSRMEVESVMLHSVMEVTLCNWGKRNRGWTLKGPRI